MIRVGMIFFDGDGNVVMVCNVTAASGAGADVDTAVRGEWIDSTTATCFAFWGTAGGASAQYTAKP